MPRISGVDIPADKPIWVSLTYIYGVGPTNSRAILKEAAIEPMVNAGSAETQVLDDGWTVVTRDHRRSAHFEHTIAVTDHGPEVLTLPG
jgi:ribosomal protein S13